MKTFQKIILAIVVILIVIFAVHYYNSGSVESMQKIEVAYACNQNKSIQATMYEGELIPPKKEGDMPTLTGKATIVLSDGRALNLKQTISADGVRYANDDESFVFWSKGNGALVLENNQEKSYVGCIALRPATEGLNQIYQNGTEGVVLRYPAGYAVDTSYIYNELGPQKTARGVKFTIPGSIATGTNLSSDTYISLEQIPYTAIPKGQKCSAALFVDPETPISMLADSNVDYSFATTTGAGAGNRYEQYIYAIPGTNPCIAVRYFIHYGVYENYPEGTIKQFDKAALIGQFDAIRRSLTISR